MTDNHIKYHQNNKNRGDPYKSEQYGHHCLLLLHRRNVRTPVFFPALYSHRIQKIALFLACFFLFKTPPERGDLLAACVQTNRRLKSYMNGVGSFQRPVHTAKPLGFFYGKIYEGTIHTGQTAVRIVTIVEI